MIFIEYNFYVDLSKLSEGRLERMLDELYEQGKQNSNEFKTIDEELNRRATLHTIKEEAFRQDQENAAKELEKERLQVLKDKIAIKWQASFEEWDVWARSLYIIDCEYTVISKARQWNEEVSWANGSEYEALEKVEQLLYYKYYDHFIRINR